MHCDLTVKPAVRPIFLLDRVFFFPYTLSIKKEILIRLPGDVSRAMPFKDCRATKTDMGTTSALGMIPKIGGC